MNSSTRMAITPYLWRSCRISRILRRSPAPRRSSLIVSSARRNFSVTRRSRFVGMNVFPIPIAKSDSIRRTKISHIVFDGFILKELDLDALSIVLIEYDVVSQIRIITYDVNNGIQLTIASSLINDEDLLRRNQESVPGRKGIKPSPAVVVVYDV